MKISSSNSNAQALTGSVGKNSIQATRGGVQGPAGPPPPPLASGVQGPGSSTTSATPAERLLRYAEHMEARLDHLASESRSTGADLDDVRSAFRDHITRLQDAMAKGLQGDDLARGIENASRLVRDGVRDQFGLAAIVNADAGQGAILNPGGGIHLNPGHESTTVDIAHSNQRLNDMALRIEERLRDLVAMDPNRDQSTIQNAREEFDAHMVRLRDALATGNMTHEDMRRSLQNIAQHLGDNLQGSASVAGTPAAQGMPGMAPSPPSGPETASTRLDTIRQAQAILTRGTGVTGSNGLPFQGTSANKPDSAVGHFLTELREATHKAKGGVPEGYTAEARLAALVQPYLPGSSLNFKV